MNPDSDNLLTPADLERETDVGQAFWAKRRMDGTGPPFVKIGRHVRYPRDGWEAWKREQTFSSTSAVRHQPKTNKRRMLLADLNPRP